METLQSSPPSFTFPLPSPPPSNHTGILGTPIWKAWNETKSVIVGLRNEEGEGLEMISVPDLHERCKRNNATITEQQVIDAVEFFSKTGEVVHFRKTGTTTTSHFVPLPLVALKHAVMPHRYSGIEDIDGILRQVVFLRPR